MLKAFSTDPNDRTVPIQFAARLERDLKRAERERDKEREALMKIEEIFVDGCDTFADRIAMGEIAREALEGAK
jgi:hypothetical protein